MDAAGNVPIEALTVLPEIVEDDHRCGTAMLGLVADVQAAAAMSTKARTNRPHVSPLWARRTRGLLRLDWRAIEATKRRIRLCQPLLP